MADQFDIAPRLLRAAQGWKIYTDATVRPGPAFPRADAQLGHGSGEAVLIIRCKSCGEEVFPTQDGVGIIDVVRHMVNSHGYRMDGRRFDSQNNEVGHA